MKTRYLYGTALAAGLLVFCCLNLFAENIDPYNDGSQYAYGENIGWVNFEPNVPAPSVCAQVAGDKVTGFVWAENVGWINFDPTVATDPNHYGVTIDSANPSGNFQDDSGNNNYMPTTGDNGNYGF